MADQRKVSVSSNSGSINAGNTSIRKSTPKMQTKSSILSSDLSHMQQRSKSGSSFSGTFVQNNQAVLGNHNGSSTSLLNTMQAMDPKFDKMNMAPEQHLMVKHHASGGMPLDEHNQTLCHSKRKFGNTSQQSRSDTIGM